MSAEPDLIKQSQEASPRWHCLNSLKNAPISVIINCSWDNKRFIIPAKSAGEEKEDMGNYYDEPSTSSEGLYGFTTLYELIKKVKPQIPTLYMWEEAGGLALTCGPNHIFACDWETTLLYKLIHSSDIPIEILEDGREAVVVTIGYANAVREQKASVVTRCMSKGHTYG